MNGKEIQGYYGGVRKIPTTIYTLQSKGGTWYAVEDSININFTYETLSDGVWVEEVTDVDFMTASAPINSLEDLEDEVCY